MIKTAAASTAHHTVNGARRVKNTAQQARATPVVQRVGSAEPITVVHKKTNIDSSLIATIAIYTAQSSVLFLIPIAAVYTIAWVVLTIKTHV